MAAASVLAVRDIRVEYGAREVLTVDWLEVKAGEVLAVIGPNGSGKSTLLRVLGLLERPTRGEVSVDGRPIDAAEALLQRRRMATVFQEPLLVDASVDERICARRAGSRRISVGADRNRIVHQAHGGTARLFQVSDRDMYARLGLLKEEYGNIAA